MPTQKDKGQHTETLVRPTFVFQPELHAHLLAGISRELFARPRRRR